jgi:glutathione S-transferase
LPAAGAAAILRSVIRVHRVPFSTNVERVALAAAHKGIGLEWVDHDAADRSAIVALSGQELVPVAEFDGEVVRGSMRIVERLEHERAEPALYPREPAAAARAAIFVSWFDRVWKGPPNALAGDAPAPDADSLMRRARGWTGYFEGLLAAGPFLAGEALGVEDVCAFPFLKYAVVDPEAGDEDRFHVVLVEILRDGEHPRLDEWVRRVDDLPRA